MVAKAPKVKERTEFALGSRPAVLRAPSLGRLPKPKAPEAPNTRDYGKAERPGFGTTGLTGET